MPNRSAEPVTPVEAFDRRRLFSSVAVIAAAAIFGLTYGLSAPLIAVDLAARGAGESLIGLNAAMHAVGVLSIALFLPRLAVRFGAQRLIVAALILSTLTLLAFPQVPGIAFWFPLRLLLGVAAETLFVLTETWTNDLSLAHLRGRMMAVYTASLSLGFAGGPAILSVVGSNRSAYWIGAAIAAIAIVPLLNPRLLPPQPMRISTTKPLQYFRLAPIAIATTLLNAAVETAGLSFIALYATGMGWSEQQGLRLVSTLMIGAIVLQLPIGWLADRVNPRRLALLLAMLSAVGALAWPWMLGQTWLAFTLVFVWGGLFVGIYTVMLSIVGSRFSGGDLIGIYAVMSIAWGGGALIGPSIVGIAMQRSPTYGLPYAIAAGCALFALFMATRRSAT
ncbi:MAG: MFS transporter [Dokdonella sp.]